MGLPVRPQQRAANGSSRALNRISGRESVGRSSAGSPFLRARSMGAMRP